MSLWHAQERDSDYHGLVFCTNSGVLGHGSGMDTALQVAQRLTTLRLEDASASSAEEGSFQKHRLVHGVLGQFGL